MSQLFVLCHLSVCKGVTAARVIKITLLVKPYQIAREKEGVSFDVSRFRSSSPRCLTFIWRKQCFVSLRLFSWDPGWQCQTIAAPSFCSFLCGA